MDSGSILSDSGPRLPDSGSILSDSGSRLPVKLSSRLLLNSAELTGFVRQTFVFLFRFSIHLKMKFKEKREIVDAGGDFKGDLPGASSGSGLKGERRRRMRRSRDLAPGLGLTEN